MLMLIKFGRLVKGTKYDLNTSNVNVNQICYNGIGLLMIFKYI